MDCFFNKQKGLVDEDLLTSILAATTFCKIHNASSAPAQQIAEQKQKIEEDSCKPPVIIIAGPTAVGKSAFAMQAAKLFSGEIISADSVQVYRGMDVGTAKPSLQDRKEVVHHLVDLVPVTEPLNMAVFGELAKEAIYSTLARGKVPIVVGGSGFYLRSLMRGSPPGPSADPFVRAHIEEELERLGTGVLYANLQKLDPCYAATISCADRQKIVRAFEIMILSQKKVSDHKWQENSPFRFCPFFFVRDREVMYRRIEQRCDMMLQQGLLQEVQYLLKDGLLENPSAASAIGYRQCLEFLKSDQTPEAVKNFIVQFKQVSRRYAKRQLTWFKKEPQFAWLDLDKMSFQEVLDRVIDEYYGIL